ncbi:BTB/POZ domain-containing protein KCTD7-like [Mercenaria mercenaria]|uniref:BTB/POZ domain-containing protein KCTD7-like n=1 Tax=Mercenaria mercenaria TaxID=6596 RepID=UPI00234E8204|nr:BTB/POZ domain-containing protein KCTD7-like [Mercenaria mercenaria]XP_053392164.1 BTB/POZ domain-containing protein KCTD7-like [Mercenaria mercenaria]
MENFPDVVELNVGGKMMTTLLSTLTKDPDSMLAAMFSGRHVISKDKDGRFFIDCDGHLFIHILNYLRFGSLPPTESILEVHEVAVYFNIQPLVESLERYHILQYRKRIAELKTQIDLPRYEKLKQEAIEKIYSSSARPHEGKTLHIVTDSNICRHGYDTSNFKNNCNVPVRDNINIYLTANYNITKEFKICLAHELSDLGFGIYSYVYNTAKPFKGNCLCGIQCHHIALLAHKIVSVHDEKYCVA